MDICLCASDECPRYKECFRGDGYYHGSGIFTMSCLSEVCNKENNYAEFISVGKEEKHD